MSESLFPMSKKDGFKELINGDQKKIVITTHHKPDADALGSSLGLKGYLDKKGHDVVVISPTDYPEFLTWMSGNSDVMIFERKPEAASKLVQEADIIFCLDFNSLHRVNELGEVIANTQAIKVLIDHHLEPETFADYELWSTEAAATAELVFDLIKQLGDTSLIDKDMAESLYAGIMTDTGSFKHGNTTQHVHYTVAHLIELGADITRVSKLIYDNNSLDRLKFTGFALSERLYIMPEFHVAYFAITAADLKRYNSKTGDTEGLVNYALSVKGIKMAALIIDRTEAIKMSFRSFGNFSVNEFARKHFNGGGHKNAAGGRSEMTLEETVAKFKEAVKNYAEALISEPLVH
jgi:phosphoesterase RecJ-like protein